MEMIQIRSMMIPFLAAVVAACGGDAGEPAEAAAAPAPAAVVDSVRPMDEEFRRFTEEMGAPPTSLSGGEASAQALARRFVRAVAANDSAALREMHLSRPEFAYLYWKDSRLSKPPYEMPPGLLWFQIEGESQAGATRLLREHGGKALVFESVACEGLREENGNRVHQGCAVTYALDGETRTERLFGNLIERGGTFKFLSYANDF